MDGQKQVVMQEHRLSRGTTLILLAAIAVLALNLLVPLMRAAPAHAQFPGNAPALPTHLRMHCSGMAIPPPPGLRVPAPSLVNFDCDGDLQ
jgi:hypothetical protein